jgi:hypothetical protein
MAGDVQRDAVEAGLVEIEDALVPAFIIEEHDDGHFTVFVPFRPDAICRGGVHPDATRVHPVDVPFAQADSIDLEMGIRIQGPRRGMQAANR